MTGDSFAPFPIHCHSRGMRVKHATEFKRPLLMYSDVAVFDARHLITHPLRRKFPKNFVPTHLSRHSAECSATLSLARHPVAAARWQSKAPNESSMTLKNMLKRSQHKPRSSQRSKLFLFVLTATKTGLQHLRALTLLKCFSRDEIGTIYALNLPILSKGQPPSQVK